MKIVNYNKFIRGVIIFFLILFILSLFINRNTYSYNTKKYVSIYVKEGETLWSIASSLQDENFYYGKDVRYIINDIKSINNMNNSNLKVGDKLIIPII